MVVGCRGLVLALFGSARRRYVMGSGTAVQSEATVKPRLVFFHSTFSGQCRRVEGFLAQVLQRLRNHGTFRVVRVAEEERPDLLERFKVVTVPTPVVVEGRLVGGGGGGRGGPPKDNRLDADTLLAQRQLHKPVPITRNEIRHVLLLRDDLRR